MFNFKIFGAKIVKKNMLTNRNVILKGFVSLINYCFISNYKKYSHFLRIMIY